jgi:membrane protein
MASVSLTKFHLKEAWNWGGLSFRQLVVRGWKAMQAHATPNQAAVVAFYAMLSLVPLLGLCLAFALAGKGGVAREVLDLSARLLPPEADTLVRDQVRKIQSSPPVALLSVSAMLLLWSASSLFVAVMDTLNTIYGVTDDRSWWKRRLMSLLLTTVEVALLVGACLLAFIWPVLIGHLGLGTSAAVATTILRWIVVVIMLLGAFELAYYFGPHVDQRWEWITPGSALGVLVLIGTSLGFRACLAFGDTYSETYGALAGVVLIMLWMYLSALALLLGAELNCIIIRAESERHPAGKPDPADISRERSGSRAPGASPHRQLSG